MSKPDKSTELSALQRAALLVEKLQARLEGVERARTEPIAVIGLGCRFPGGASDEASYWKLLRDGVDAVREVPASRWDAARYYDPERGVPGKMYGTRGGYLDDVEHFDAPFFGISPREAETLDPQQRLVLEVAYEALENAGQAPDRLVGSKTGVFLGVMSNDNMARLMKREDNTRFDGYSATGNGFCFVPGRLSYVLGLQGPSMPVDTACSSSLVSLHLACESLRSGESTMALAGGVNLILSPEITLCLCNMQALAGDGRCKTFDASADGYVRGEGCGILVLKRLSDAQRDGDKVLALIRGSAVNHDGASGGLTVPSGPAQQTVVQRALDNARIDPALVGYIEAHGTGTPLGDPIELRALGAVLGKGRPADRPFFIGSVKTNIGHLEPAAGIAGVIKTILSLRNKELPPHLHFQTPNPHIEWDRIPARVPTARTPWPAIEGRRIAGVSSFGLSGTNAHVVLEEAPEPATVSPEDGRAQLVVLSAKTQPSLALAVEAWRSFLKQDSGDSVADLSHTAALGRAHHDHRIALVAKTRQELAEQLDAFTTGESHPGLSVGRRSAGLPRKVVFVFPGQGSQWQGMGCRLYADDATFREVIDRCHEAMRPFTDWSLRDMVSSPESPARWNDIDVIQPTLFAMQVALAAVWRSLGMEPHAVVGHSMGEVAAAHVAGALSLEDGARIICERSKLLRGVSGKGAMAVVDLSRAQAEAELRGFEDRIAIAVSNSPRSTVISGDPGALKEVVERLERREVFCRWVKVDVASHSPQMDPLRQALLERMSGVKPSTSVIPICSTVTGTVLDGREMDGAYWVRNLREPVVFADSVKRLVDDGNVTFIELSPHPVLIPFVEAMLKEWDTSGRGLVVPSLRREQEEWSVLLSSLGRLYTNVDGVDWRRLHPVKRRPVSLPTYPWQREKYWIDVEAGAATQGRRVGGGGHPLLGASFTTSVQRGARFWESALAPTEPAYLADHRVGGAVILPATAYLEMALSAAHELLGDGECELVGTSFKEALLFPEGQTRTVQTALTDEGEESVAFLLSSQMTGEAGTGWLSHAAGRIRKTRSEPERTPESLEAIRERCGASVAREAYYEALASRGVTYGPRFQGVQQVWRGSGEALGHVRLPEHLVAKAGEYRIHPVLLDACFQVVAAAVDEGAAGGNTGPAVPVLLETLRVHERPGAEVFCHVRSRAGQQEDGAALDFDLVLMDGAGRVLVEANGLRMRRLEGSAAERDAHDLFFGQEWRRAPEPGAPDVEAGGSGKWLLLGEGGELGAAVESLLRARQDEVLRVDAARELEPVLVEAGAGLRGVIHFASSGAERGEDFTPATLEESRALGCGPVLDVLHVLTRARLRQSPRLWLVTRGVHDDVAGNLAASVGQAPLWGLGRTLAQEHPEFRCKRVDVSARLGPGDAAEAFVRELVGSDAEEEVSLRGDGRYVARIVRSAPERPEHEAVVSARGRTFRAGHAEEGRFELRADERCPPGAGELELEVEVLVLHGDGAASSVGCGGRVVARGDGVRGVETGDERIALMCSALGSHVTVPVACTVERPASLPMAKAAAMAATLLPAWYALHHLGRLQRGDRLLVAGAPSETKRAVCELASRAGATVVEAEAGLMDGVDIAVLTSGANSADKGLSVLNEGGRVLDLREPAARARAGGANVAYCAVDVTELARRRPERLAALWREVVASLEEEGAWAPRVTAVPVSLAGTVVRDSLAGVPGDSRAHGDSVVRSSSVTGAQASAAPVVVLNLNDPQARVVVPAKDARRLREDGTYLITGGLGGLGLAVAGWMVEQGARRLVLLGRGTQLKQAQQEAIAAMESAGARITVTGADVAQREQLARVFADIAASGDPLRGVVHAAGVLDDGVLAQQTEERFRRVMAPKVLGAWHLHELTRDVPLDFFVLYSSAASFFGAPGQGNYAAANAFMDTLALQRRARGLPALSINWGAFSEVGLAAAQDNRGARLAQRGAGSLTPAEGNTILGRLLDGAATGMGVMPLDLRRWTELSPQARSSPWWSELIPAGSGAALGARDEALLDALRKATPEEGRARIEQLVREQMARVLRLDSSRIDREAPLQSFGLDSLMGLELRNRLEAALGVPLPASLMWKHPTLAALGEHLTGEVMDRTLAEQLAQASLAEGTGTADDNEVFVL
ncbi:polyketide synthase [Myxococcus stipitatus DSM 14675]|uniref:Polyketide synthase n=1 Tax=Myxococcus stipitatus (strain DSM 14675 / JCM 12634 / Mx s8) TaxID=1278073 RepID=L7UGP7_MYXSD|nr:type I polyketide synthase [Myxococcus stipitatus]AGC45619.1 polyketide synthase [Myxococcus stipitatus DSM 14675]